jgi:hypothetical protein
MDIPSFDALNPFDKLPNFRSLNEIGVENEHFNSTTLSDK